METVTPKLQGLALIYSRHCALIYAYLFLGGRFNPADKKFQSLQRNRRKITINGKKKRKTADPEGDTAIDCIDKHRSIIYYTEKSNLRLIFAGMCFTHTLFPTTSTRPLASYLVLPVEWIPLRAFSE